MPSSSEYLADLALVGWLLDSRRYSVYFRLPLLFLLLPPVGFLVCDGLSYSFLMRMRPRESAMDWPALLSESPLPR